MVCPSFLPSFLPSLSPYFPPSFSPSLLSSFLSPSLLLPPSLRFYFSRRICYSEHKSHFNYSFSSISSFPALQTVTRHLGEKHSECSLFILLIQIVNLHCHPKTANKLQCSFEFRMFFENIFHPRIHILSFP